MELKPEWMNHYLTPEERKTMRSLAVRSYSPDALKKLAEQPFAEQSHRQYARFRSELQRLVSAGADPGGPEGRELARFLTELNDRRSQGDPEIREGMKRSWDNFNALPEDKQPQMYKLSQEERAFIRQACASMYRQNGQSSAGE